MKVHISLPALAFWLGVLLLDRTQASLAALLCALLHEGGHLLAMSLCGISVTDLTVLPYGLEMRPSRHPHSFSEDLWIQSAGCAVNLLSIPLFLGAAYALDAVIPAVFTHFLRLCAASSLPLGVLNMLPILSLDGGAVLEALLSMRLSLARTDAIMRAISFVALLLLWVLAVYVFLFSAYNYSLFAMCLWLFARIFCVTF